MNLAKRISSTETHQFRMIFNDVLNYNETLFGGLAMKWMDEVAYITALRFTRMKVVTVSVENLKFKNAIKSGSIVETIGRVLKTSNMKINIHVEIYVENPNSEFRESAVEATFVFTAIDTNNKPICFNKQN